METVEIQRLKTLDLVYVCDEGPDVPEGLYIIQKIWLYKEMLNVSPAVLPFDPSICRNVKMESVAAVYPHYALVDKV